MRLKRVRHSRALPSTITSHQMIPVSKLIHGHVLAAIEPLLETKPKYHAIHEILGTVGETIEQLEETHRKRRIKSAQDLRGATSQPDQIGSDQVSRRKRETYLKRQIHLRRLRQAVNWQMMDTNPSDTDLTLEQVEAAKLMNAIFQKRIDRFETLSYEESHAEVDHLISDIEASNGGMTGLDALSLLGLSKLYDRMQQQHQRYIDIHNEQTRQDAVREDSPKLTAARRELRRTIRVLLTSMHFDVENGDTTLAGVLGHVDEIIDKARAVAELRKTLRQKEKEKAEAGSDEPVQDDPADADDFDDADDIADPVSDNTDANALSPDADPQNLPAQ